MRRWALVCVGCLVPGGCTQPGGGAAEESSGSSGASPGTASAPPATSVGDPDGADTLADSESGGATTTGTSSGSTSGEASTSGDPGEPITSIVLADYVGTGTRSYRRADGVYYSRYTHFEASADFSELYALFMEPDVPSPGTLRVWEKAYYAASQPPADPCVATYALLFFADDGAVTEAGDYLSPIGSCTASIPFGYQRDGSAAGLGWSPVGHLVVGQPVRAEELLIASRASKAEPYQVQPGYVAYSHVELLEVLPTFVPAFGDADGRGWREGGGAEYHDVAHIVFHHGVREPGQTEFTECVPPMPGDEFTELYRTEPNFDSYASDYYFAPGVGLVQEGFLYNEHNAYFDDVAGSAQDCTGLALSSDPAKLEQYLFYIDGA